MDAIEQKILAAVDARREMLLCFARDIAAHAEPGFYETRTAGRVAEILRGFGLPVETGLCRTGVRAVLHGAAQRVQDAESGPGAAQRMQNAESGPGAAQNGENRPGAAAGACAPSGPCLAVLGELDGILCPAHPGANPENGLAHACGHHAQLAAVLGAAAALCEPEVCAALGGSVQFFAVPAEEYVAVPTREALRREGVEFCCGKSELLRRGAFEGVDLALTTHVHMIPCESDLLLGNVACTGFVSKTVTFRGKAAHAAAAPHLGVNAQSAAALALSAIGYLRETFRECDTVRIHTKLKESDTALNVVPDVIVLEAMIRASSLAALHGVAEKFDRACLHCAAALGATAEIVNEQGYMPVRYTPACPALVQAAAALRPLTAECAAPAMQNLASTDVGDLSQVLPVVNFTHGGVSGALHSADFSVVNEEKAFLAPAKMMALTAYHLLRDGAAGARQVMKDFTPVFTRESYVQAVRGQS